MGLFSNMQLLLGYGKNITNNNNNIIGLMPENLKSLTDQVFTEIKKGNFKQARAFIENIEKTNNHETSNHYINFLKILTGLSNKSELRITEAELNTAYIEARQSDKGVILAGILRIKIVFDEIEEARAIYNQKTINSVLADCQYLEFIADKEELDAKICDPLLDSKIAVSIIYGYMRIAEYNLALDYAIEFKKKYNDYEFRIALFLVKSQAVSISIFGKHYWTISKKSKDEIKDIIKNGYDLSVEADGLDSRIFSSIVPYIIFLEEVKSDIGLYCYKHVERWRELYPEHARFMEFANTGNLDVLEDGEIKEFQEYKRDLEKHNTLEDKLINGVSLTVTETFLVDQTFDNDLILVWLKKGGLVKVSTDDNVRNKDIIESVGYLLLATKPKYLNNEAAHKRMLEHLSWLSGEDSDLSEINPNCIKDICINLNHLNLHKYACSILEKTVDTNDPWLSPLMEIYLYNLFNANQYKEGNKLIDLLKSDTEADNSILFWSFCAHMNYKKGLLDDAIVDIDKAISIQPDSSNALLIKANVLDGKEDKNYLISFFDDINTNIYNLQDQDSLALINIFTPHVQFYKIETILIDLFTKSPYESTIFINTHYLNFFIEGRINRDVITSDAVGCVLKAVKYKKAGKETISLIVKKGTKHEKNPHIIEEGNIYSDMLLKLQTGEVNDEEVHTVELLETLSPYVALFHITSQIRNEMNDGTDQFLLLETPSDPYELPAFFENITKKLNKGSNENKIFTNLQDYPFSFIANNRKTGNPIEDILSLIAKPEYKIPTPKPREIDNSKFEKLVLDIYSVTYISLCCLSDRLPNENIYITRNTELLINNFIEDIKTKGFFIPDFSGTINGSQFLAPLVDQLKILLRKIEIIEVEPLYNFDAPQELSLLNEKIDETVYETILISACKDITWVSFDNHLPYWMDKLGIKSIDAYSLISKITQTLPHEDKIFGLSLAAHYDLPFPIRREDFHNLIIGFDLSNLEILHYILKGKIDVFANNHLAITVFEELIISLLARLTQSYHYKGELGIYRLDKKTEKTIDSLINIILLAQIKSKITNQSAEMKLTKFICRVLLKSKQNDYFKRILNIKLSEFISGQFLDYPSIKECYEEITANSERL
ncbi:tetratricopeptide repeat protein [Vreelandella boliviensis]|uniref:Tetratricopeptide repeat protein n=1 Tax=Vreelandella boliviensis LC1 TaxID=1072583 RepID=A0A265DU48_9GAMM|nr:hypothetical protein [Halomonas boliviensis]EHJ91800.1 hypothetical protein KUC_3357 [Halomonas boliviensis LC1]OZT72852.1 hypothetical protein CE457_16905 [Halomonas boliviensis LC1]